MRCSTTALPGVLILEPRLHGDERGFFMETYHAARMAEVGIRDVFVQDNHSRSARGVLRGLHYQWPHPQSKLCRVIRGEVLDVVVDIRRGSPFFGRCVSVTLSEENRRMIYVPRGFAHGFVVRSALAEFLYKCDEYYHPECERGVAWDDPVLGIEWGIESPVLSERDRRLPHLRDIPTEELPDPGPRP